MYVCICNAVTDSDIKEAQAAGHTSFDAIQKHLGVADCCGKCESAAREIISSVKTDSGVVGYFRPNLSNEIPAFA